MNSNKYSNISKHSGYKLYHRYAQYLQIQYGLTKYCGYRGRDLSVIWPANRHYKSLTVCVMFRNLAHYFEKLEKKILLGIICLDVFIF